MDPSSREDLSALMDGELDAEPTRFLLRRLDHDPELGATWSRWHLIRACMASDSARMTAPGHDTDFASRIAAALVDERAQPQPRRHWAQYVGGGALAAGVAVVALMFNAPNPALESKAPVAQSRPAPAGAAVPIAPVAAAPAADPAMSPWLLSHRPTVLAAQPAAANVVYGTGLMQPDYLRRAAFAQTGVVTTPALQRTGTHAQPLSMARSRAPASSTTAARPR